MKSRVLVHLPIATALAWMWGCGDANMPAPGEAPSNAPPVASAPPSASASSAASAPSAPSPQSLSIHGFTHAVDGSVLPGVDVCLVDGVVINLPIDPVMCTVSAADGSFAVSGAGANGDATLTFAKDGFAPMVRPINLEAQDVTLPSNENVLHAAPLVVAGTAAESRQGSARIRGDDDRLGPHPPDDRNPDGLLRPGG